MSLRKRDVIDRYAHEQKCSDRSEALERLASRYHTRDQDTIALRLEADYEDFSNMRKCGNIFVMQGDAKYNSIFGKSPRYSLSYNASYKQLVQETLWEHYREAIDNLIHDGVPAKTIMQQYRWLHVVRFDYLMGLNELFDSEFGEHVEEELPKHERFLVRTAHWLYFCITEYVRENCPVVPKPAHVGKAKLYDTVIDTTVWNPVQFRRYLPFQFINKIGVYKGAYFCVTPGLDMMSFLEFMNSTYQVRHQLYIPEGHTADDVGCSDEVVWMRVSNKYITPDEIRAKGYADEADLHESFGDLQIVKSAILYFERSILVQCSICGENVSGRMSRLESVVRNMTVWDVEAYLEKLYNLHWTESKMWYRDGEWKRLRSGLDL